MPTSGSSERLRKYHQRTAKEELWWPRNHALLVFSVAAIALLVNGVRQLPETDAWTYLAGATGFAVVAYGLFAYQAWTRWVAAALFAGSALADVLHRDADWLYSAFIMAIAAFFFVLPSTGRLFAAARGAEGQAEA
jgi:hypothetical protein